MTNNPTLPASLASTFRDLDQRISALERGNRSVAYRQSLTTNDSVNARELFDDKVGDQYVPADRVPYAAALVNPRYPVLVSRFHVYVFGTCTADVYLRASMGNSTRETQRWTVRGVTSPKADFTYSTFEIAWLHGAPVDQWADTDEQAQIRRGNVEFHVKVTGSVPFLTRNESITDDAKSKGFTDAQAQFFAFWVQPLEKRYPVYFRESEYTFLAPLTSFPSASIEGTLIDGSNVPGYPVVSSRSAPRDPAAERSGVLWPNQAGTWPVAPDSQ